MKEESIRIIILLPVVLALLSLLTGAGIGFSRYQKNLIDREVQESLLGMEKMFQDELDSEAELLHGLIDFIKNDARLQNAWFTKDRAELLRHALPIFKDIHSDYRITHLYFHTIDGINFLRVHKPDYYGDHIDRFTLKKAADEGQAVHGLELGPFGTLTLRLVHPWIVDGKVTGYIEIGEEIKQLIPRISKSLGVGLIFTIHKRYLDRQKWEEGLEVMGHSGGWDELNDFIIIDKTIDIGFSQLQEIVTLPVLDPQRPKFTITVNTKKYRGGCAPLADVAQQPLGNIIILKDITADQATMQRFLLYLASGAFLIAGCLFLFFWFFLGRIETRLIKSRKNLIAEIKMRRQIEMVLQKRTKQLRSNRDKLLRAERSSAIGRVAAQVAHDIRNPMTSIGGFARRILKQHRSGTDKINVEYLNIIIKETDRLENILNNLLSFTEPDIPRYAAVDVNRMIRDTCHVFIGELEQNNIALVKNLDPHLVQVLLDEDLIKRVLMNVIKNSIEAVKAGGTISVSTMLEGSWFTIEIVDTGIGIHDSHLDKVFDPFFTTKAAGSGLGLTIASQIINNHGGTIDIRKRESAQGMRVIIKLPVKKSVGD